MNGHSCLAQRRYLSSPSTGEGFEGRGKSGSGAAAKPCTGSRATGCYASPAGGPGKRAGAGQGANRPPSHTGLLWRGARVLVLAVACTWFALAWGEVAGPGQRDGVDARRAARLAAELRCLVCQNQSIADSNAELAVDLRRVIGEQLAQGRSDREIIAFMVERYGDFVLYRPPFKATTLLLWLGPALLLAIGVGVFARTLSVRHERAAPPPLTDEERARARELLGAGNGKEGT